MTRTRPWPLVGAAAALLLVGAGSGAARAYGPGVELGVLPEAVPETSGLTEGSRDDGVLFTHNDSTDLPFDPSAATIVAATHAGDLVATIRLQGVGATDTEDIAWGPGPDGAPALYLADIGDNFRVRPQIWVYVVPEPTLDAGTRGATVTYTPEDITTVALTYPDGRHDAETFLVHPTTGQMTIVTKTSDGLSGIYVADRPAGSGSVVLSRTGTLDVNPIWTQESHNPAFDDSQYLATGGEISADGAWVTIRTYTEAFEWPLGPDGDVAAAVATTPLVVTIPPESQGEAIAYEHGGGALITSSENTRLMHRMALLAAEDDPDPVPDATPDELPQTGGGGASGAALALLLAAVAAPRVWPRGRAAAASAACVPPPSVP